MTTVTETAPVSISARLLGRILSGLVIVFLLLDGAIKLVPWPVVTDTLYRMG
jgi:F0F1-type ATP synthase membrane subunit a